MHMVLSRCPNFGLVNALDLCLANRYCSEADLHYEIGTKTTQVGAGIFNVMPAGKRPPFCWSIL